MAHPITKALHSIVKPEEQWKITLLTNWNTILGTLSTKVCLEKIQGDTLLLGVYDSCWMQELYLLSGLLIATINQNLDQPRIKHLRFKKIVPRARKKNAPAQQPVVTTPIQVTLTTRQQEALATVKDPHLRHALQQFLIRCYKEK
jgi:hypothetical protein